MSNPNLTSSNPKSQFHSAIQTQFLKLLCALLIVSVPLMNFAQEPSAAYRQQEYAISIDQYTIANSGAATFSILIEVPPGTNGLTPSLSITYNSQNGYGLVGEGWSISGLDVINRCNREGVPNYDSPNTDVFEWRGEELIKDSSGVYHTEHETHHRIVNNNGFGTGSSWTVTAPDGTQYKYGTTTDSRIEALKEDGTNLRADGSVRIWALSEVIDSNGNAYRIAYDETTDGQYYPITITYTYNTGLSTYRTITLTWETRPDPMTSYREGSHVKTTKRLQKIEIEANSNLVRRYDLSYTTDVVNRSLLSQIQQFGTNGSSSLSPYKFTYHNPTPGLGSVMSWGTGVSGRNQDSYVVRNNDDHFSYHNWFDIDGDGMPDDVYRYNTGNYQVRLNTGSGLGPVLVWGSGVSGRTKDTYLDHFVNGSTYHKWMDINGDGLPDDVYRYNTGNYQVRLNTGSGLGSVLNWGSGVSGRTDDTYWDRSLNGNTYHKWMDMNGDGLPDDVYRYNTGNYQVRLNTGSGLGPVLDWGSGISGRAGDTYVNRTASGKTYHEWKDMNGDGLPDDVYRYDNGNYQVRLNTGSGLGSVLDWGSGVSGRTSDTYVNNSINHKTFHNWIDMNGDGLPDDVYRNSGSNYQVRLNTGSGLGPVLDWGTGVSFRSYDQYVIRAHEDFVYHSWLDINGDGLPDDVYRYNTQEYQIRLNQFQKQRLLQTATVPSGGEISFDYVSSSEYDNTDTTGSERMPISQWVVSSITMDDGLVDTHSTSISYKGGLWDAGTREFRGFREITETDPTGAEKITTYLQDDDFRGLISSIEQQDDSGNDLLEIVNTYNSSSPVAGVVFPYLEQKDTITYDGVSPGRTTRINYTYDSYGNIETETRQGDIGTSGDEAKSTRYYAYNTSDWIVNRVCHDILESYETSWIKDRETKTYYDDNATLCSLTVGEPGNPTDVDRWLDTTSGVITEQWGYDDYGNVTSYTDGNSHTTTYTYDTTYKTLLTQTTYPITPTQTEQREYDNLLRLWKETDRNGNITETQYDVFSRVTKVIRPLDSASYPTIENIYSFDGTAPEYTLIKQREEHSQAGTLDSYVFVDGFGRVIQTKEEANTSGEWIVTDTFYDGRGRQSETSVKYTSTNYLADREISQNSVETTYDALDRITAVTKPDGTSVTTVYDQWTETITNEKGVVKIVRRDAYYRIKQIDENDGTTVLTTIYEHNNATGELETITDPLGNDYTMTYDSLGRKIQESDEDRGTWTFDYDDNSNLITQIDNKNQTVSYEYDSLNRKTMADLPVGVDTFYSYDEAGHGDSVGRLTEIAFASNPSGPIASYSFEGNADDTTGVNDGTVFGATLVSGVSGQAYDFDGTNDYIALQNLHFDTIGALDELTVTAWVKTSYSGGSWTANWAILDFDRSDYFDVYIRGDNGKVGFSTADSAGTIKDSYGTTAVNDGQWHLICAVYDGVDKIIYVDGVEDARHVNAHAGKNLGKGTTRYGFIGDGSEATSYNGTRNNIYYDGAIDELNLYTRALSATEIDQIYTGQSIDPTSSSEPELWAYKNFSYDAHGRITSESLDIDGKLRLTQFAYDAADRMSSITYPNTSGGAGEVVNLTYDKRGMLNNLAGTNTYLSSATYTPLAKINQYTYGNSTTISYSYYDNASTYDPSAQTYHSYRLRSIGVTGGSVDLSLQYEHDKVGNVKKVTDLIESSKSQEFDYDDLDRLDWADGNNLYGIKTYSYDKAGNILTKDGLTYTYGNGNRIASDGLYTFTHDVNGNIVTRTDGTGTETFTYDGLNRLVHLSGPVTESYAYDDFETRVKKISGGETTYYFNKYYEEAWSGGSSPDETIKHYFADDHRIATRDNEGLKFKYSDHLGSATRIANTSGTEIKANWYMPFGADAAETGTAFVKYKYTDKEQDETGLYYYGARYYDAELGRFMAADSILPDPYDSQQLNRFAYVRNNPVKLVDPDGHTAGLAYAISTAISSAFGISAGASIGLGNSISDGFIGGDDPLSDGTSHGGNIGGEIGNGINGPPTLGDRINEWLDDTFSPDWKSEFEFDENGRPIVKGAPEPTDPNKENPIAPEDPSQDTSGRFPGGPDPHTEQGSDTLNTSAPNTTNGTSQNISNSTNQNTSNSTNNTSSNQQNNDSNNDDDD